MRFDPGRGRVIAAPPLSGRGSWAGAPGAWREGSDLFVTYRVRRPPPLRGYEMHVAVLRGDRLERLASINKDALGAESIERSALVRVEDEWRLYVSCVDKADRKWRILLLRAAAVDRFDAADAQIALHPGPAGMSAVKDPWLRRVGDEWRMFVSCARRVDDPALHATGDALATGLVRSESGLATSADGIAWRWRNIVFSPSEGGWDRATARLTTAWRAGDGWSAYYDGAASIAENYEERCGLARSPDLVTWERVSADGPAVGTARGAG
ncbi:MAG TPA: hypothetical protein VEU77_12910, partial [Candidatus Acidoferrales bacterium]|nr:hypothetical protein [Candidatus Acidoferrales bacterium]